MYKVGGLFSGVGGIELGFKNQGFDIRWANDNDIHCSKTYKLNHKHKYILRDIHKLSASELESVDVMTGGFPCQAFSVAGYRKGLKDERGNLFFEILRLIDEFDNPPKVLLEGLYANAVLSVSIYCLLYPALLLAENVT